jgi:CelD/BcsL family acetyltransferase involved in cellulose biosynthesis
MSASLTPVSLEYPPNTSAFREEWSALAEASGSVFATPEWTEVWWRHFGAGQRLRVGVARAAGGRAVAVVPLVRGRTGPLRVVRFAGHGPADQLGPVCDPNDMDLGAEALRQAMAAMPGGWDVFVGDYLPGDQGWDARLGGTVLRRFESPVLRFEGRTWDEYLRERSRNFREQATRRERKLAREHDLRFRLTTSAAELTRDLDALFALHGSRWSAGSNFSRVEAFHREFAAVALARGWLRLWRLDLDGRTMAAWLGFRFGGAESYYQAGRDPSAEGSVGFVLLVHTIRSAREDGVQEYRFLRGDEEYKGRFATADPGVETVAVGGGLAGKAAVAAGARLTGNAKLRTLFRRASASG